MSDVDSVPDTQMIRFDNLDDPFAPVEETSEGGEFLGREVEMPERPEKRKTDTCAIGRMKKGKGALIFPNTGVINEAQASGGEALARFEDRNALKPTNQSSSYSLFRRNKPGRVTKAARAVEASQETLERKKKRYDDKSGTLLNAGLKQRASSSNRVLKKYNAGILAIKASSVNRKAVRTENAASDAQYCAKVLETEIKREDLRPAAKDNTEGQRTSESGVNKKKATILQRMLGKLMQSRSRDNATSTEDTPRTSVRNENTGSEYSI
ncbi:MAG: hypothetical protein ABJ360_10440 [Roseobacter sp.]|uniref:hypothetical protein n=1 Tax=Alphaproteobacteria TaxID=28211 RepID=UPI0032673D68